MDAWCAHAGLVYVGWQDDLLAPAGLAQPKDAEGRWTIPQVGVGWIIQPGLSAHLSHWVQVSMFAHEFHDATGASMSASFNLGKPLDVLRFIQCLRSLNSYVKDIEAAIAARAKGNPPKLTKVSKWAMKSDS
jgi:hypothetical protein